MTFLFPHLSQHIIVRHHAHSIGHRKDNRCWAPHYFTMDKSVSFFFVCREIASRGKSDSSGKMMSGWDNKQRQLSIFPCVLTTFGWEADCRFPTKFDSNFTTQRTKSDRFSSLPSHLLPASSLLKREDWFMLPMAKVDAVIHQDSSNLFVSAFVFIYMQTSVSSFRVEWLIIRCRIKRYHVKMCALETHVMTDCHLILQPPHATGLIFLHRLCFQRVIRSSRRTLIKEAFNDKLYFIYKYRLRLSKSFQLKTTHSIWLPAYLKVNEIRCRYLSYNFPSKHDNPTALTF